MTGSIRAYARHRKELGLSGGTHTAVRAAIDAHRIALDRDGTIDFDKADAMWLRNSEPAVPTAIAGKARPDAPAAARQHAPVDSEADGNAFFSARTRRELAEAQLAELKLAQNSKELLPAADVRKWLQQMGKIYAGARNGVPAQLATQLIGKTDVDEIVRIIRDFLTATDNRIADELEARFPDFVEPVAADDAGDL